MMNDVVYGSKAAIVRISLESDAFGIQYDSGDFEYLYQWKKVYIVVDSGVTCTFELKVPMIAYMNSTNAERLYAASGLCGYICGHYVYVLIEGLEPSTQVNIKVKFDNAVYSDTTFTTTESKTLTLSNSITAQDSAVEAGFTDEEKARLQSDLEKVKLIWESMAYYDLRLRSTSVYYSDTDGAAASFSRASQNQGNLNINYHWFKRYKTTDNPIDSGTKEILAVLTHELCHSTIGSSYTNTMYTDFGVNRGPIAVQKVQDLTKWAMGSDNVEACVAFNHCFPWVAAVRMFRTELLLMVKAVSYAAGY